MMVSEIVGDLVVKITTVFLQVHCPLHAPTCCNPIATRINKAVALYFRTLIVIEPPTTTKCSTDNRNIPDQVFCKP